MRYTFEEVSVKATKRWTDAEGKKRSKTKKFFQTLNPFNKCADGSMKTRQQIQAEICAERDLWLGKAEAL